MPAERSIRQPAAIMQNLPAPASERSPPRQAARATPAAPFRIIPGSAYCALWRILHKAHLLRDLKDLYQFEPGKQDWAQQMAGLLIEARDAARDARAEGKKALDPDITAGLTSRYRSIAASGLATNVYRRTATAGDARRIARRFLKHEDMILRFITRPDLDIFTNNQAERTIRPVKVQQRSSGGCWRTLGGLADFAVVQSYLSTATKWGIPKIDALRSLFNGHPWMPPGLEPAG